MKSLASHKLTHTDQNVSILPKYIQSHFRFKIYSDSAVRDEVTQLSICLFSLYLLGLL